jgi:hypothetical protein
MGRVYKDTYVIDQYRNKDFYDYPILRMFGSYDKEYNLTMNIEIILKDLIYQREKYCKDIGKSKYSGMYENEQDYKDKHKVHEQKLLAKHVFDRYEEFDTTETDIELRDGETIKINDEDYKVEYKFNKNLQRHELYIDYEIRIEIDEELKKQCEDQVYEINKRISEHNKMIDESKVVIDERFKNYIKSKNKPEPPPVKVVGGKSILNEIKSWFTRKHE